MNELLSVRGLTKNFDRFSLQELSFSLPEGCITGFIGANGAGKTTTLRTILDLIHKDSGDVRIFGLDMSTDARAIKDRIGVVLDDGGFYDELSLSEMKRIIAPAYSRWSDEDFRALLRARRSRVNTQTDSHALRSCPFFMLIFRQNPRSRRCRNGVVLRHCSKQRRFLPGCFLS